MMESFLSFSKPVTIDKREEMDLVPLLKKIADEKELSIKMTDKHVTLENDIVLIHSIFSNLILNSKEAGADRIEVTFKKGKNLKIFLKDNGKGIDPKIQEKIWYPFFTTKEKGTGMGLPSIRKIINSLDGEILLQSTSSSGTTFKIIFYG
jgi:signal transduction histidine kinase